MTKAEEAALKRFPNFSAENMDDVMFARYHFRQGYDQAEKDLALSIDDIEKIHTFLYAVKNNKQGVFTFTRLSDEQYEEVIRRFNKAKEEKK